MVTPFNIDGGIHQIPLPGVGGALWLCGKHFIAPDVEKIRKEYHLDHVVCLVEEHELQGRYDPYIEWHHRHADMYAIWKPIHDLSYPEFDDALQFVGSLTDLLKNKCNVVVHCAAGIGRAGTTATAIAMHLGMNMNDALQHIRHHRPLAGPESGAQIEFIHVMNTYLNGTSSSDLG